MLWQDLKANPQTTNGGAVEHGKRNFHVSHVYVMSNTKEEAMQSKIIFICPVIHALFWQMMTGYGSLWWNASLDFADSFPCYVAIR